MKIKLIFKKIRYFLELIAVRIGLFLFTILGLKNASDFGSFLARKIGKLISVNDLAKKNLTQAFPDLKLNEVDKILEDMWDNLGRVSGEFIHVCQMDKDRLINYIEIDESTSKNIKNIKKNYKGGIIFSGHIGNWEIGPKFFLHHNINVKTVYRPLNNFAVDEITSQVRGVGLIAKNSTGNRQIINEIKQGNYIIILMDQKVSDGIAVPFFHKNALTSTSIAKLALKYDIPLIPARSIRIGKDFKFKIEVGEAIQVDKSKVNPEEQIFDLMHKVNQNLESWIREYKSQWFWVHNRWKK